MDLPCTLSLASKQRAGPAGQGDSAPSLGKQQHIELAGEAAADLAAPRQLQRKHKRRIHGREMEGLALA
jgi:hypothetical protein